MFSALSTPALLAVFALAAGCVWIAGVQLARATDALDTLLGFSEAIGGIVVLAIVTNLPEIAIVASGALRGDLSVAVGNLLGGIAVQTLVLVVLDARGRGAPLMTRTSSPALIVEGVLVLLVLAVCGVGSQLPSTWRTLGVFPPEGALVVLWIAGVFVIGRMRRSKPTPGKKPKPAARPALSLRRCALILIIGGLVTLAGGVALEGTSQLLAKHWHLDGAIFGATVLAAATSLPEVSTGWAAVRLGADKMAVSDILGGNAFLPVLFLEASLLSHQAALPQVKPTDLYLAGLGFVLTTVYVTGLVIRSKRRLAGVGIDSLIVVILYALGIAGLLVI